MSGRNRKCGNGFRAKVYLTVEKGSETHRLPSMLSVCLLPHPLPLPPHFLSSPSQGLSGRWGWVHIGPFWALPQNLPPHEGRADAGGRGRGHPLLGKPSLSGKLIHSLRSLPAQQMPPFSGGLGDSPQDGVSRYTALWWEGGCCLGAA